MKPFILIFIIISSIVYAKIPIYAPEDGVIKYGNCDMETGCPSIDINNNLAVGTGNIAVLYSKEQIEKCPVLFNEGTIKYRKTNERKIEVCKTLILFSYIDIDFNILKTIEKNVKKGDLIGYTYLEKDSSSIQILTKPCYP